MVRKRHPEEQIIAGLNEAEAIAKTADLCRWKAKRGPDGKRVQEAQVPWFIGIKHAREVIES